MSTIRARRRKNWAFVGLGAAIVAGVIAWPFLWTEIGTRDAVACLARYRAPRTDKLGAACTSAIPWFVTPSRIPWTRTMASYRAEELSARIAIEDYVDAAVAHPDKAALGLAGEALDRADHAMKHGSTRIELNELGRALNAPNLGYYADLVNDRATLVAKADFVIDWSARRHALATAFEDATTERVSAIVHSYAGMDPRDEDLRAAVGAALCLVGEAKLGMDFLTLIQDTRAVHRYEAMVRNFGDARAGIVACAEKAHVAPPPKPDKPEDGQLDQPEVRAVLRLRTLSARADANADDLREASLGVIGLLLEGTRPPRARVALVAALLASGHQLEPGELVTLSAPKMDEPAIIPPLATAFDWLEERRGVVPSPGADAFAKAAARVEEIANSPAAAGVPREPLVDLEAALWIEAARSHAQLGDADALLEAIDHASAAFPEAIIKRIVRATGLLVAGQAERGLHELGDVDEVVPAEAKKRALVLQAELLASLGRRAPAAKTAVAADAIPSSETPDRNELDVLARWTRFALARDVREAPPKIATPELERVLAWPTASLYAENASVLGVAPEAVPPLLHTLALWSSAFNASPEDRLAIRYTLLDRGGASPRARVAYLDAATALLPNGGGDVEIWLDAFSAIDARTLPMRTAAWTRAEAARWRGDAEAAKTWAERAHRLAEIADHDPELAALIGL